MYKQRGVTLIELLTVIVVIGILTAIALPSYSSSMRKTRRADAKVALTSSAQQLERTFRMTTIRTNPPLISDQLAPSRYNNTALS